MITLKIDNVQTKVSNLNKHQLEDIKEMLSYSTMEYFGKKHIEIKRTLYDNSKNTFPTGLLTSVIKYLKLNQFEYELDDQREAYIDDEIQIQGVELRNYQQEVVDIAVAKQRGIIQVATGGGKTLIAAAIAAKLNIPTIFCVHTKDLLRQAHDAFSNVLKIPIGIIGAGQVKVEKINICMIQTLSNALNFKYIPADEFDTYAEESPSMKNKAIILEMIAKAQCVIVDECHHISAQTYVSLMTSLPGACFRYGLSGTPYRDDGRDLVLYAFAGKSLCQISASYLISKKYLMQPTIYVISPGTREYNDGGTKNYAAVYSEYIVENKLRNKTVADYAKSFYDKNRKTLILVTQVKHGKILRDLIREHDDKVELLTGEVDFEIRTALIEKMKKGKLHTIIGTSLADEGLDIPIIDTLILAGGGKSSVRALQRIGRVLRIHPEKQQPIVIDFYDYVRFLLGHSKKRLAIYKTEESFKIVDRQDRSDDWQ